MTIKNFAEKINHPEIVRLVLPLIVLLEIGRTFYHTNAVYVLSRVLLLYFLLFAYSEAKQKEAAVDPIEIFELFKSFPFENLELIKWKSDSNAEMLKKDFDIISHDIFYGRENSLNL